MSEIKVFKYEIGGKQYTQQALVWGQIKKIKNLLSGTKFAGELNVMSIIDVLEDKMPAAVAIVLKEDGKPLKEKNIEELANGFEDVLELETMVDIIDDFFLCNRIGSLLQKLKTVFGKLLPEIDLTSLTDQSQVSQKEISPSESKSSGDSAQENADHTSNSATEK